MSALPPKVDIAQSRLDVRFVPKADIGARRLLNRPLVLSRPRLMSLNPAALIGV
jgi:hypothetical protein